MYMIQHNASLHPYSLIFGPKSVIFVAIFMFSWGEKNGISLNRYFMFYYTKLKYFFCLNKKSKISRFHRPFSIGAPKCIFQMSISAKQIFIYNSLIFKFLIEYMSLNNTQFKNNGVNKYLDVFFRAISCD